MKKAIKVILLTLLALVLVGVGTFFYLGQSSKNGTAPGIVKGSLVPCPDSPNCVSSEAGTASEKRVEPFAAETWPALPAVIKDMGGSIKQQNDTYIAAEFTSAIFGFVDDLELRKTDEGVQVRSASRVGESDAGVNAARVAKLREKLAK